MKEDRILKKLKRKLRKVQGQLLDIEMIELYLAASEVQPNTCIVEIGSYQGKSTLLIAYGTQIGNNNKLYAIDPHLDFVGVNGGVFGPSDLQKKYKNIVKFYDADNIFVVALKSNQICNWEFPIGMIFIDGDHSYEGVKFDYEKFKKNIVTGGKILFHDSIMPEIKQFLDELELNSNELKFLKDVGTMKIYEKL